MTSCKSRVDQPKVEAAIRSLLAAIGEDPGRDGLRGTPNRVAEMFADLVGGLDADPSEAIDAVFENGQPGPRRAERLAVLLHL